MYLPGKLNVLADALSRVGINPALVQTLEHRGEVKRTWATAFLAATRQVGTFAAATEFAPEHASAYAEAACAPVGVSAADIVGSLTVTYDSITDDERVSMELAMDLQLDEVLADGVDVVCDGVGDGFAAGVELAVGAITRSQFQSLERHPATVGADAGIAGRPRRSSRLHVSIEELGSRDVQRRDADLQVSQPGFPPALETSGATQGTARPAAPLRPVLRAGQETVYGKTGNLQPRPAVARCSGAGDITRVHSSLANCESSTTSTDAGAAGGAAAEPIVDDANADDDEWRTLREAVNVADTYSDAFWLRLQRRDAFCTTVVADVKGRRNAFRGFMVDDSGLLWRDNEGRRQLVLPEGFWTTALMHEYHSLRLCHAGARTTLLALRERFWFSEMSSRVTEFVRACPGCARAQPKRTDTEAGAHALPPPPAHQHTYGIDAVGPFPKVVGGPFAGCMYLITMFDLATGYGTVEPVPDVKATTFQNFLTRNYGYKTGFPKYLHHDKATALTCSSSDRFFADNGITTTPTSGHNPDSNGGVERGQRTLIYKVARTVTELNSNDWPQAALAAMFAINVAPLYGLGISPHELTYGEQPVCVQVSSEVTRHLTVEERALHRARLHETLLEQARVFRERRKERVRELKQGAVQHYKVGDVVYLFMGTDTEAGAKKLRTMWQGPHKVMPSLASDHAPLVRVLTGRGDREHGVLVHPDRLMRANISAERQFFEPAPVESEWHTLEDGEHPGHFELTDDDIKLLAKHCSQAGAKMGSQPLRPTEFEPSSHCLRCRVSVLRPKHTGTVQCAFCDAVMHEACLQQKKRLAGTRPRIFRCSACIAELPRALLWVMKRKAQPASEVSRAYDAMMMQLRPSAL